MRACAPLVSAMMVVGAAALATKGSQAELRVAQAEVAAGRYAVAERRLLGLLAHDAHAPSAKALLGDVYEMTGRRREATTLWNALFDDYEKGDIDKKSARDLMAVARAARGLGSFQDASDLLRDAVAADPHCVEAHLEWAALFLEKYKVGEAERDLHAALALDPSNADAHVLLARVFIEQGYDIVHAIDEAQRALEKNPNHAAALVLLGELALDNDEFDEAQARARSVLAINPNAEAAHVLLAAMCFLRDEQAAYERERDAALQINPRSSRFFHGVAEFLVKHHRYREANDLEEQALAHDDGDAVARAALGQNLLRLGREREGIEALRRAFERDAYNVRTYNVLHLFEEVIPREYETIDLARDHGVPIRLRVAKAEHAALVRAVPPLVANEWKELAERYDFRPNAPVQIELYQDPEHYAVRTVGLPRIDVLGVTFGTVVTARSPLEGRFNWGMMLWHEVAHVFAIELSRARVPRWFTEGLSEWETEHHDPTWRRHTHRELYRALREKNFPSVAHLSGAFLHARSMREMVVAYHASAETVAFLIRRWGFPSVVRALHLFGDGHDTPFVIRSVTGLSLDAFDAALRDDLSTRLVRYAATFREVCSSTTSSRCSLEDQYDVKLRAAKESAAANRDPKMTELLYAEAAELDPEQSEPLETLAQLQRAAGKGDEALATLARAAELDPHSLKIAAQLADAYRTRGDRVRARQWAARGLFIAPADATLRAIVDGK